MKEILTFFKKAVFKFKVSVSGPLATGRIRSGAVVYIYSPQNACTMQLHYITLPIMWSSPTSHNLINLVAQKAHCEIMLLFVLEMSEDGDIVSLVVSETAQKIVHCLVGKDLFVDKTWCMVKKTDILEDIAIEDSNSPFVNLTQQILVGIIFL